MSNKTVSDYQQNELTLKKINSILKQKNKELEVKLEHLQKEYHYLKQNNIYKKSQNVKFPLAVFGAVFVFGIFLPIDGIVNDSVSAMGNLVSDHNQQSLKSNYVIENLRGDVIETHVNWKWAKNTPINVSILNAHLLDDAKIDSVKNAISSIETITLDDSLLHKGPKGSTSVYHSGWQGALNQIDDNTLYTPPTKFNIFESDISEGNIVILLDTESNPDGYSGFTKNVVDKNEILKSFITIYDADSLSTSELNTIVKHEFGHALGLAHSTDPMDLMYPIIETDYPIISDCNIDALESLYDGNVKSEVVCKK